MAFKVILKFKFAKQGKNAPFPGAMGKIYLSKKGEKISSFMEIRKWQKTKRNFPERGETNWGGKEFPPNFFCRWRAF